MKENPPVRQQISYEQKLFSRLVSCTTEDQVAEIIKELDDSKKIQWVPFGGTADNMGIIQNQAKDPVGALIEKATNSIDAVIQKEVRKKGIQPRNMQDAMERLFRIKGGLLNRDDKELKKKHSQHVIIVAEGKKERPTISIIDDGEGIHPSEMTQSILRLGKSNKVNVPYLQGVYGQGGSGVLPFCGSIEKHYHFMLIAARVHPDLTNDRKGSEIGFTLVRLSPNEKVPTERRLLYYEYFADEDGKIVTVPPQEIDFPNLKPQKQITFGCFIKLFDYQLEKEYSDFISVELKARFELKLVRPALPIWFHDARKEYSSMAPQAAYGTLASDPEKSRIIRQRFTIQSRLDEYGISEIDVILFKHKTETKSGLTPEENRRVDREHVVMFSVNGQVHFGLRTYSESSPG